MQRRNTTRPEWLNDYTPQWVTDQRAREIERAANERRAMRAALPLARAARNTALNAADLTRATYRHTPLWVKIAFGIVASNSLQSIMIKASCVPYDPTIQAFDYANAPILYHVLTFLHAVYIVCGAYN